MNKVVVTGGCGYIGSHTIVDLINKGFEVISIDNNSRSTTILLEGIKKITGVSVKNYCIDICDREALEQVFVENKNIVGIIHFAAYKSVPESLSEPLMYFNNNINSLLNILDVCQKHNINSLIFSSSCSVYGNADILPVSELSPLKEPECSYARTKRMGEEIILDYINSGKYNTKTILLRYFNPVGAHSSSEIGELGYGVPNNLIPVITETAIGLRNELTVFGDNYDTRDGSCIRDFVHVMDIADAHTKALQYLVNENEASKYEIINLGTGIGVTILESIKAFEKVSNTKLNYKIGPRREGDIVAIYADNKKAKELLKWNPKNGIEEMMLTAWNWQLKKREL